MVKIRYIFKLKMRISDSKWCLFVFSCPFQESINLWTSAFSATGFFFVNSNAFNSVLFHVTFTSYVHLIFWPYQHPPCSILFTFSYIRSNSLTHRQPFHHLTLTINVGRAALDISALCTIDQPIPLYYLIGKKLPQPYCIHLFGGSMRYILINAM